MRWIFRALLALVIVLLAGTVAMFTFFVVDKTAVNNYTARLSMSISAATLSDEGVSVLAQDGQEHRLDEAGVRKVRYYLARKPLIAPKWLGRGNEEIHIRIGTDEAIVRYLGEDRALVLFESSLGGYTMRLADDNLWKNLLDSTGEKYYQTATNE